MNKYTSLILLVILLGSYSTLAQKCKPAEKVKDDFTGVVTEYYGAKVGSGRSSLKGISYYVAFYLFKENGQTKLITQLDYWQGNNDASVNDFKVPKGSIIRLKLTEGMIELTAEKIKSQKRKLSDKVVTANEIQSTLTEEQVSLLQSNLLEKYQITPTDQEPITDDVSSSKAQKLLAQINCLLKTSNTTRSLEDTERVEPKEKTLVPIQKSDFSFLEKGSTSITGDLCFVMTGGQLGIEHFLGDQFSMGLNLGYIMTKDEGSTLTYSGFTLQRSAYQTRTSIIYGALFGRYYLKTTENLGIYAGVRFGPGKARVKVLSGSFIAQAEDRGFVTDIHAGIKYKLNDKTALAGELGYGMSIARLGASITL